jgi:hypothetical protein
MSNVSIAEHIYQTALLSVFSWGGEGVKVAIQLDRANVTTRLMEYTNPAKCSTQIRRSAVHKSNKVKYTNPAKGSIRMQHSGEHKSSKVKYTNSAMWSTQI